ncbi:MAG: hypothetical protein IJW63_05475 [Lachnospiraceae bacterium]|nr:hypothetical protein [Lachnospiraceae bacterium]
MTDQEKINFISGKIKEINAITSEIEEVFPEKSFKMDGILIGNIVEVLTAHMYGITLYKQSEKTYDGEVGGRKVQIKGTQGNGSIVFRDEPDYLLVEYLDKENGTIQEIYNGPGSLVWPFRSYVPSMNHYTIRVNKLRELDETVADEERIKATVPVQKFKGQKQSIVRSEFKPSKSKERKTLVEGYINRNNQENRGCLNKPGNHYNQVAYLLHCNCCGFEYEANGCDVAIRKCPKCM